MKVILSSVLALTLFLAAQLPAAERLPNIVYIIADDLGYNELGCYGQKIIRTPNIDRLAAEGMRFTQHYSGQAVCAPCRCVLMTGKHTGHAFVRDNGNPKGPKPNPFPGQIPLPDSEETIAEILKEKGYSTGGMGKWGLGHIHNSGSPMKQGFDHFFGYICQVHAHNHYPKFLWRNDKQIVQEGNTRELDGKIHSQDAFTAEALEFVRNHKEEPFFLYLPYAIPHLSIQTTSKWLEPYKKEIEEEDYVHKGYLKHPFPRAGYAAMVTMMDDSVGQVMKLIEELGLDDDTLIIFTSDNGPTFNRLGGSDSDFFESAGVFKGLKGSLYEGGIRVPMIARWPGKIKPGTESDLISAHWDVLPTVCDIVEADYPDGIDGISFLPTLTGEGEQENHEFLYWEFPSYGGQHAVRMGDWKGTRQNMFKGNMHVELYNLATDPGETKDVAAEHPKIVKQIEEIMVREHTPSKEFPFLPEERKSQK